MNPLTETPCGYGALLNDRRLEKRKDGAREEESRKPKASGVSGERKREEGMGLNIERARREMGVRNGK